VKISPTAASVAYAVAGSLIYCPESKNFVHYSDASKVRTLLFSGCATSFSSVD